jgi:hypothetical protein
MLRQDYRQLLGMVVSMLDEQKKHAEVAKTNGAAIQEIRAAVSAFSERLSGHMEDEEAKIESNADALRELAVAVDNLQDQLGVKHHEHHDWIQSELDRHKDRAAFWKEMRVSAAKWGLLGALGVLASILWSGLQDYLRRGLH